MAEERKAEVWCYHINCPECQTSASPRFVEATKEELVNIPFEVKAARTYRAMSGNPEPKILKCQLCQKYIILETEIP